MSARSAHVAVAAAVNDHVNDHVRVTSPLTLTWVRAEFAHENEPYFFKSLNAWLQRFSRKPGIHHRMHRGSMARAASAAPMSSTSQPN